MINGLDFFKLNTEYAKEQKKELKLIGLYSVTPLISGGLAAHVSKIYRSDCLAMAIIAGLEIVLALPLYKQMKKVNDLGNKLYHLQTGD
ncbi:Uncharacterised protein [Candidatus Tiddalikarchaeum anstoanum]|nr:Uncharacterised protein [Candidatus Tiddalikarchaeum anstoanum]